MFDVSHMGEFLIKGTKALDLIQKISSNDASKLIPGKVQYSYMPNDQGGIVDDLLVYMLKEDEYMLVVNASNIEKDWEWINQNNNAGADLEDISENTSLLAVQGPRAEKTLQKLTKVDLSSLPYYSFTKGNIADVTEGAILSATGYTGAGGFEVYVYNEFAPKIWNVIMQAGEEFGINPAGLGARDTLRLEMGYALYGNDIDDTTSPIEAGLGWVTKFNKDFINAENIKKQKEEGPKKRLVGFKMMDKGIPRKDYEVLNNAEETIGRVTSGTMSPSLGYGIGMGYIDADYSKEGSEVLIAIRKRRLRAKVVKLPFYKS